MTTHQRHRTALLVTVLLATSGAAACKSTGTAPPGDEVVRTQTPVNVYTNASGTVRTQINSETAARTTSVPAPVERVWAALPEVYEALKLPLTMRQDAQRTLGAQSVRMRAEFAGQRVSRYVSCGRGLMGGDAADSYEVTLDVVSVAAAAPDGGTTLQSSVGGAVAKPVQTSGDPVQCVTTGRLEERIAQLVAARLAPQR